MHPVGEPLEAPLAHQVFYHEGKVRDLNKRRGPQVGSEKIDRLTGPR
jgi:hypothetical protein